MSRIKTLKEAREVLQRYVEYNESREQQEKNKTEALAKLASDVQKGIVNSAESQRRLSRIQRPQAPTVFASDSFQDAIKFMLHFTRNEDLQSGITAAARKS